MHSPLQHAPACRCGDAIGTDPRCKRLHGLGVIYQRTGFHGPATGIKELQTGQQKEVCLKYAVLEVVFLNHSALAPRGFLDVTFGTAPTEVTTQVTH